jgi:hypothetical protein
VFSSRSFVSRLIPAELLPKEIRGGQSFPVLLPLVDSLNHDHQAKMTWLGDVNKGATLRSELAIVPGSEIFNNYGPKSNEELLLGYGFCLPNNPYNHVGFAFNPPFKGLKLEMWKTILEGEHEPTNAINSAEFEENKNDYFIVSTTRGSELYGPRQLFLRPFPPKLCLAIALYESNTTELDIIARQLSHSKDPSQIKLSKRLKTVLVRTVFNLSQQRVKSLNSIELQDLDDQEPSSQRYALSIQYRLSLTSILNEACANIERALSPSIYDHQDQDELYPPIWRLSDFFGALSDLSPDIYAKFTRGMKTVFGTSKPKQMFQSGKEAEASVITLSVLKALLGSGAIVEIADSDDLHKILTSFLTRKVLSYEIGNTARSVEFQAWVEEQRKILQAFQAACELHESFDRLNQREINELSTWSAVFFEEYSFSDIDDRTVFCVREEYE